MARELIDIDKLIEYIHKYTDCTAFPLVAEVAYAYPIDKDYIYEIIRGEKRKDICESTREGLALSLKRLHRKAEMHIISSAAAGRMPYTLAIFLLKQPHFGYTDRQDVAVDTHISVDFSIPRPALEGTIVDITPKLSNKPAQKKSKRPAKPHGSKDNADTSN